MDPNLKFSCGYKPADVYQYSSAACGGFMFLIFSAVVLIFMITISLVKRAWLMALLFSAFSVFFYGSIWKSSLAHYIHVTATELQVVRSDGKVERRYALKNIWGVNAPDRDTLNFMVRSDAGGVSSEVTLSAVADIDGLLAAVSEWGGEHISDSEPELSESDPETAQPRVLTEEEADALHAAQHLLNQGMISPKQYSGLLIPPVPECEPAGQPDINAQNAADYQQRQEMLAQQLGTVLPDAAEEKEKDENGRAGFI